MPRQTRFSSPAFVARDSKTASCPHPGTAAAKSDDAKTQCSLSARIRRERVSCLNGCLLVTLQKIA